MTVDRGEAAVAIAKAVSAGSGFPDGVPDTPANRDLYARAAAEAAAMTAQGVRPDIPVDYSA